MIMEQLFYLFGPILIVCGVIIFVKRRNFAKASTVVYGSIVEIKMRPAQRNRTAYYPVIKYYDASTLKEEIYESSNPYEETKYKVGESIELRYLNNGSKKQIHINNWFGIWGLPFMLFLFGIIFGAIGFLLFFFS